MKKPLKDYTDRELAEKTAQFSQITAENTGTIKSIMMFVLIVNIIVGIILGLSSCSPTPLPGPSLFLKKTTVQARPGDSDLRQDTLLVMTDDYFEVSIYSYSDGHYTAKRDLEKSGGLDDMRLVWLDVTDSLGEELPFQTSTEFLNHMSARSYEMVTKAESKFRIDYTFKRKDPLNGD